MDNTLNMPAPVSALGRLRRLALASACGPVEPGILEIVRAQCFADGYTPGECDQIFHDWRVSGMWAALDSYETQIAARIDRAFSEDRPAVLTW